MKSEGWHKITLGEVITLKRGYDLPTQDREPGYIPVVSSSGITGFHNEAKANAPGVVTGRYGTLGDVFYLTEDFWPLNTTLYVKDFKGNHPRFIAYFLQTLGLAGRNDKSSVPGINRNDLHRLEINIPSIPEQHAIADMLGMLDDKIELNRQMNKTLEAIGHLIFQQWFIDFEFPNEAGKPYKSSGGEMVPNEELGKEIPKEWNICKIGDEIEVGGGSTPKTSEQSYWVGGDIYWATPKDMSALAAPVLTGTERKITHEGLLAIGSKKYPQGTLFMSSRAPIGYLAISDVDSAVNQGMIAMICRRSLSSYFMLNWCALNMEEIESRANGTTFKEITKSEFRSMPIILPPKSLLSAFDAHVAPMYSQVGSNIRHSKTLAQIRDSLLPKLMSGKVQVPVEVE